MEPVRKPQDIVPRHPGPHMGNQPARPVMSDFAPRSAAHNPQRPQPFRTPASPTTVPAPQHQPATPPKLGQSLAASSESDITPGELRTPEATKQQPAKEPRGSRSGTVGFVVFILLTIFALSPLVPGKIFSSLPGVSETESTGDQTVGCAGTLSPYFVNTAYNTKRGFPIIYAYSTTTTLKATCDGAQRTAIGGRASQFNPLAVVINVALSLVVAIVVAKLWRRVFGSKS